MLKRTLALSATFLTLTAADAQAIELSALKRGTAVAALGSDFANNFTRHAPATYVGKASLGGTTFDTAVQVNRAGEIESLAAEIPGASLQEYRKSLAHAEPLFEAANSPTRPYGEFERDEVVEVDDCRESMRVVATHKGSGIFSHTTMPGTAQKAAFMFGPAALTLSGTLAEFRAAIPVGAPAALKQQVPNFKLECRADIQGPLVFPGVGPITEANVRYLNIRPIRSDSEGNKRDAGDYMLAGVPGSLEVTWKKNQVSGIVWLSASPDSYSDIDEKHWLTAVSKTWGLPSNSISHSSKSGVRSIIREWDVTNGGSVRVAVIADVKKGTRSFMITLYRH